MNNYQDVLKGIDELLAQKDLVLIALDGMSGAGKSKLTSQLGQLYDCNIYHMDHFFLPDNLRTEARLQEVGGNVDYERFKEEVIGGIFSGQEFSYQAYDCQRKNFSPTIAVSPNRLNIIEGVYSLHPNLVEAYDLKIFMSISREEQEKRILQRNGAKMLERFLKEWIPLENRYFEELKIEDQCNIVLSQ